MTEAQEKTGEIAVPDDLRQLAEQRAERIRGHLENAAREYAQAVIDGDWKTLGCATVQEWSDTWLGPQRFKPEARKEIEDLLLGAGLTFRETAKAVGVSPATVAADQKDSVQELNTGNAKQKASRDREKAKTGKIEQCAEWLVTYLQDHGPAEERKVREEAFKEGYAEATVTRAIKQSDRVRNGEGREDTGENFADRCKEQDSRFLLLAKEAGRSETYRKADSMFHVHELAVSEYRFGRAELALIAEKIELRRDRIDFGLLGDETQSQFLQELTRVTGIFTAWLEDLTE